MDSDSYSRAMVSIPRDKLGGIVMLSPKDLHDAGVLQCRDRLRSSNKLSHRTATGGFRQNVSKLDVSPTHLAQSVHL